MYRNPKPLILNHSGPVNLEIRLIAIRVSLSDTLQLKLPTVATLRN